MTAESEIRHGRHCVIQPAQVHFGLRGQVPPPGVRRLRHRKRLREIFADVCSDFEARLVEMDGEDDHSPLAGGVPAKGLRLRPRDQPQGRLSRLLRRDRQEIAQAVLEGRPVEPELLRRVCGGAPIAIVRQYIEQQQRPD